MPSSPKKRIIIAIDGGAGSGKSTLARELAKRLSFLYIDTGAMYRAITWKAIRNKIELTQEKKLQKIAQESHLELKPPKKEGEDIQVFIDGRDVTEEIRSPLISSHVSDVAKVSGVRECMVAHQRKIAEKENAILEGRDIGTVVFPNADIKFFLVADVEKRAARRKQQLAQHGTEMAVEKIQKNLQQRDEIDSSRKDSPLKSAEDAILIDTTEQSVEEMVEVALKFIKERL